MDSMFVRNLWALALSVGLAACQLFPAYEYVGPCVDAPSKSDCCPSGYHLDQGMCCEEGQHTESDVQHPDWKACVEDDVDAGADARSFAHTADAGADAP